jgi:hypothetical protein
MARAVIPEWVVPAEATVRLVRRRAGGWWESSGGEARYVGVIRSLDWVVGVRAESPVTEYAEPAASPSRVLVEVLAAEQAMRRVPWLNPGQPRGDPEDPCADEREMERLGHGFYVAALMACRYPVTLREDEARFLDGALDTLRWLVGEVDRPPVPVPLPDGVPGQPEPSPGGSR